jgi:hypothetical protein
MRAKTATFSSVLILVLFALWLSACGKAATPTLTPPTPTAAPNIQSTVPAAFPSPTAPTQRPLPATPTPMSEPRPTTSVPISTLTLPTAPPTQSGQGMVPLPPHRFVGTAKIAGADAPDGTEVIARVDTATFPTTTTGGIYRVDVRQPEGGSFAGKTVTFTIKGSAAPQTGIWELGGVSEVNLSVGG